MALFFVNALADLKRQFFITYCSSRMLFEQIVTHMRRHFNSESRKLSLQSDMYILNLTTFMKYHGISDQSQGLPKIINHIYALAPQLPHGFGDDACRASYFRRAVMRFPWAQNPIVQLTTSRYNFIHLIIVLNESLHFEEEISLSRTDAQDVLFGQYLNDTRDVSRHSQGTSNCHKW